MRKLEKENRRRLKLSAKRTSKRIKIHQIELIGTGIIKIVKASFHTDPQNYGVIIERTTVPYSVSIRNLFY